MSRGVALDRSTVRAIVRLARLQFLVPGILLYGLGVGIAVARGGRPDAATILFGYAILGLAHLSVSFSNDYFDRSADVYARPSRVSGGSGVLVERPQLAAVSIAVALGLLVASGALAIAFGTARGYGLQYLVLCLGGGWLGYFYSAPPLRLSYRGWGELATSVAAGLVMPGMGYATVLGRIDGWFALLSLPLMLYGLYFIVSVELPDMEADRLAGKRTFVARFGRAGGERVCLASAAAGTCAFALLGQLGWLGDDLPFAVLAVLSAIPLAVAALGMLVRAADQTDAVLRAKVNVAALMTFLVLMIVAIG